MEIPLNDVVQLVSSVVIPAGAAELPGETLLNFQVPETASSYVLQLTSAGPFNYPNNVGVEIFSSLDGVNYVQSVVGTEVGSTGLLSQIAVNSNCLSKYLRLTGWNSDTVDHSVSVWLIAKK